MSLYTKHRIAFLFLIATILVVVWIIVMSIATPKNFMGKETSTLLYSSKNELLGARIAPDGQWRFPPMKTTPEKFTKCIIEYEDQQFWWHPGINPLAIVQSFIENIKAKKIVRGGSTITMQLARISLGDRKRNFTNKLYEINVALFYELVHTKEDILSMYCSVAPFGGNTIGLETASWRYFGRSSENLSWSEAATLAVLPNSPALIHLGRQRDKLLHKRNNLLLRLHKKGIIDKETYELSLAEVLPDAPKPLPNEAPHLISTLTPQYHGTIIHSTLNNQLQHQVQYIVNEAAKRNSESEFINNAAVIVAEVETGNVLAYVGNTTYNAPISYCNQVDVIKAPRSTGSTLKPILYAAMLRDGSIMPQTLIADTPFQLKGFSPQNFNKTYNGAVPADEAIRRSLNVPLTRMIREYKVGRLLEVLRSLGITTLNKSESHYGMSLILGGGEATLFDMCSMYSSLARMLNNYKKYYYKYNPYDIHPLHVVKEDIKKEVPITQYNDERLKSTGVLNYSSLWWMVETMSGLNRPEEEADWNRFGSMKKIAWKTGTSYGGKDAWAIGFNTKYIVGVWVGNATGQGRPGLTGVGYAAPIMFNVFSLLPSTNWFQEPYDDMEEIIVCKESGHKASLICPHTDTIRAPKACINSLPCPYHKMIKLSADKQYQVDSECYPVSQIICEPWFVLPPTQEYYYSKINPSYKKLPPIMSGCGSQENPLGIIYPEKNAILIPTKGFDKEEQKIVLKATHRNDNATIYWHLDDQYIGYTDLNHDMAILPEKGQHTITIVDQDGNSAFVKFSIK